MSLDHAANFTDYLRAFKVKDGQPITNTRVGDNDAGIFGGSYHIADTAYPQFLERYSKELLDNGAVEYLTEVQLHDGGPILVDLDFRFPLDCRERKYDRECLDDIVSLYLEELKTIYQFDDSSKFNVYVLEKDAVNPVPEKNLTKDGVHIIIGIASERRVQVLLRRQILQKIGDMLQDIPIINQWDDVLDLGISEGRNYWQLYGSTKPGCLPYKLTCIYKIKYNSKDRDFDCEIDRVNGDWNLIKPHFPALSARHRAHPTYFYTSSFIKVLEDNPGLGERRPPRSSSPSRARNVFQENSSNGAVLAVRNADDLRSLLDAWLDSISAADYLVLREPYECVMALPDSFYGNGSYNNWMRVGWALRNIDDRLFIVWIAFSAQWAQFNYSDIPDLYDKWRTFDEKNPRGLKTGALRFWVYEHAPAKYRQIIRNSAEYKIQEHLGKLDTTMIGDEKTRNIRSGYGDWEIAEILHIIKPDFVCVSVKNNIWYQWTKSCWVECDSGTALRKCISVELRAVYTEIVSKYMQHKATLNETDHADQIKKLDGYIKKLMEVVERLSRTSDKKNIMTEAKDMFWDPYFLEKLDANPYLLCFKNGVVDFKEKVFRKGKPDDYLSKCTGYDFVPLNRAMHATTINEIESFMHQLMPVPELYEYMWDHLASVLIGTAGNQTFHMMIGAGSNGKSMLMALMDKVLGSYFQTVALSIITGQRAKVGGTSPELVALKGIRYAVMQEPDKDERINVGIMKNLTSGVDPIQARGLYQAAPITFMPQFKLVLCSNEFMKINSQDHGTWRRIRVVDFMSKFTDNPVANDPTTPYQFKTDTTIINKLDGWKSIMAAMLVERAFETNGVLRPCPMVEASSDSYRERQDYIAEFISDRLVMDPAGFITKSGLAFEFKLWFESTYGRGGPNVKDVQAYMDKKYAKDTVRKVWIGVRFVSNADTKVSEVDDSDIGEVDL